MAAMRDLAAICILAGVISTTSAHSAHAQSATAGAIAGVVRDATTGEPLPGIPIELSSTSLLGKRSTFSDERGAYKLTDLPPGRYVVTFFYDTVVVKRSDIFVGVQKTTPVFQAIDTAAGVGEIVTIVDSAPAIDPTSTTQGITLDSKYLANLPNPGRTFESSLEAAAGAQGDVAGNGFSGSTSLENQYNIDGINTTAMQFGVVGSSVINDFIEETEIITGGYNAEYGRATGAVVNVATKSGTNVLAGSVFAYLTPGGLAGATARAQNQGASIDAYRKLSYDTNFGAEVGGPIVKNKLFFYVGMAPRLSSTNVTRVTKRQIDCRAVDPRSGRLLAGCDPRALADGGNADGTPDRDPETQQLLYEDIDQQTLQNRTSSTSGIGKLTFAWSPQHQGQVSLLVNREAARAPEVFGLRSAGLDSRSLSLDGAAKWTSKLDDNHTELEAVLGWHRGATDTDGIDDRANATPRQLLVGGQLENYALFGDESQATLERCHDGGADDRFPLIPNCPMDAVGYAIGGPGAITHAVDERLTGKLGAIERFRLLGSHEVKGGFDVEQNRRQAPRLLSGGALVQNSIGQVVSVNRWIKLAPFDGDAADFADECRAPAKDGSGDIRTLRCAFLGGNPGDFGTGVDGETLNWSAYLRDSWQIRSNVTINAGLRYEEQRLRYARQLRDQLDPLSNRKLGKNALALTGQWAPRLGVLYDWTKEGRSKAYAHWGRFYESIPLDINDRTFGGELGYRQDFSPSLCGSMDDPRIGGPDGLGCISRDKVGDHGEDLIGESGELIAPGTKGQYLDEAIAGVEYELLDDLAIGVALQTRRIGRIIEDMSTDSTQTYIIGNPGEFSAADEHRLERELAATSDPKARAQLEQQLTLFRGIRGFDRPERDYTAITIHAQRRFSPQLYLQASYTYARTRGNYPGTLSSDNLQIDPNISSQYDLIELLANRRGPLPQDRPHALKIDGYYVFALQRAGTLTVGARFRAQSGAPTNALGAHYIYGPREVFLLPRGSFDRAGFDHNLSLRLTYTRPLARGMSLELFADIFNLYDRQTTTTVDDTYAPALVDNNTSPISGGEEQDLVWLKRLGSGERGGLETDAQGVPYGPAVGNLNFRNSAARSSPIATQFGMKLAF
jgi:Carboxypeptidase regulatory-like domain/TonB dependent receptor